MILKTENLDLFIGRTHILRNISLHVQEGEIVCLLGRNGAGKSSLIKTIIGLYPVKSGKIWFKDRDLTTAPPRERVLAGIGYSPDDARVFTELSVEENLNLSTWVTGKTRERHLFTFDKIFSIFPGIKKYIHRKGMHLSGGEKKMVSIARALALDPSLILLDEAFEGLAPLVVSHFIKALKQVRGLGITILLGESNVRLVSQLADRAYIVERGEIAFEGAPRKILEDEKLIKLVGK
jgi:branched-chain amino acid transport system ATP-binding protein